MSRNQNTGLMSGSQAAVVQPTPTVGLSRGRVQRIGANEQARWFALVAGRAWLTTDGDAEDRWLEAGEGVRLAAGVEAVVEAAVDARFQLVEDPAVPTRRGAAPMQRWVRRWARRIGDHRRAVQWGVQPEPGIG